MAGSGVFLNASEQAGPTRTTLFRKDSAPRSRGLRNGRKGLTEAARLSKNSYEVFGAQARRDRFCVLRDSFAIFALNLRSCGIAPHWPDGRAVGNRYLARNSKPEALVDRNVRVLAGFEIAGRIFRIR